MKKLPIRQYSKILFGLLESTEDSDKALTEFVEFLASHNMISKAKYVLEDFETFYKEQKGEIKVKVETATKLDAETLNQIKATVGKDAEITNEVIETMKGGVKIYFKNKILDGSLDHQLNVLRTKLSN